MPVQVDVGGSNEAIAVNVAEPPVRPSSHGSTSTPVQKMIEEDAGFDSIKGPPEVANYQFADWLKEERRNYHNCMTLPLTCVTWVAFLFVVWAHGHVEMNYRVRQSLKLALEEQKGFHIIPGPFNDIVRPVQLGDLTSIDEMWSWMETAMVPVVSGTRKKPGFVRSFNQVMGTVQLRQTRVAAGDCKVGDELTAYYRQACHGSHGSGTLATESYGEFNYSTDSAFTPGRSSSAFSKVPDEFNAKRYSAFLDILRPSGANGTAAQRIGELREGGWIDESTSTLEVLTGFYNAELKVYAYVNVQFNFKEGGLMSQDLKVDTIVTNFFPEWYYMIPDFLWLFAVLKFIAQSCQKAADIKTYNLKERFCGDFWTFLDWLGIGVALFLGLWFLFISQDVETLNKKLGMIGSIRTDMYFELWFLASGASEEPVALGVSPREHQNAVFKREIANGNYNYLQDMNVTRVSQLLGQGYYYSDAMSAWNSATADALEAMVSLLEQKAIHKIAQYVYAMIICLRFFRGFRGQPRLKQITSTIASAGNDLVHYALIMVVVFLNFGLAGHALFGSEVGAWSSITKSMQSTLAMAFGRVDFTPLYEIAPFSATIWLFGYAVSIVLLLLNMYLAIIADHYGSVFHHLGDKGYGIVGQLKAMFLDFFFTAAYIFRAIYRMVWAKLPKNLKMKLPKCRDEEPRRDTPYELLYSACEADPSGETTVETLMSWGLDQATAKHLHGKALADHKRQIDEHYPLDLLFDEFDDTMVQYYHKMEEFSAEMKQWYSERQLFSGRLMPRQGKLEGLARSIKTAEASRAPVPPISVQMSMKED